jgi:hypothetical protein
MRVSLRERSEPGANAPTKAQAVGVGPHGINTLEGSPPKLPFELLQELAGRRILRRQGH